LRSLIIHESTASAIFNEQLLQLVFATSLRVEGTDGHLDVPHPASQALLGTLRRAIA
jgi:hypothetical protein